MSKCIECKESVVHYHGSHFCKDCAIKFYQNVNEKECICCKCDIEPIHKTGKLTCKACDKNENK